MGSTCETQCTLKTHEDILEYEKCFEIHVEYAHEQRHTVIVTSIDTMLKANMTHSESFILSTPLAMFVPTQHRDRLRYTGANFPRPAVLIEIHDTSHIENIADRKIADNARVGFETSATHLQ